MDLVGDAVEFGQPHLDDASAFDSDTASGTALLPRSGAGPATRPAPTLRPGTFLELRRTNQSETGVLVRVQGQAVLYVSRSGEVRVSILDNVMYVVDGLVPESVASDAFDDQDTIEKLDNLATPMRASPTLTEELGPKTEAIRESRKACCRALRRLEKQVDQCHSVLTKAASYNLYHHFRSPDPSKSSLITSQQAVRWLLGSEKVKDPVLVFAMHQQLMDNSDMFLASSREMRGESRFLVQSFDTLKALYTVRRWISQNSWEMKSFVGKCATRISTHRAALQDCQSLDAPLQPFRAVVQDWTATDQMFIQVFCAIAINQRMIQDQPYSTIVADVLKRVGLYDQVAMTNTWPSLTFDRFGAIVFLRDLGILPAWQTVGLWNPDLNLQGRFLDKLGKSLPSVDHSVRQTTPSGLPSTLEALVTPRKSRSTRLRSDVPLTTDPVDSLRYDFGDLPVYVIDDAEAQELDDGLSIEPIQDPSGTKEAWIHVHIADPTAYLDPSDSTSLQARSYLESLYLPGFSLPMLPPELISAEGISLGSGVMLGGRSGQKTLTFSARLNEAADVVDFVVRPGFIRNTKLTTYEVVAEVLDGRPEGRSRQTVSIGPPPERQVSDESLARKLSLSDLDDAARDHIRQLGLFAKRLTKRRVRDGALGWQLPLARAIIGSDPLLWPSLPIGHNPRLFTGKPSVSVILPPPIDHIATHNWGINSAQTLVTEMMLLAGRVAGRFYVKSREHNLPIQLPFRSQPSPDLINSSQNKGILEELRKHINPETGLISPFHFQKSRIIFMPAANGLEPLTHFPLGINDQFGYCKVTSPLRRYSDLLSHWQIKNTLLREAGKPTYEDKQRILSPNRMVELLDRLDRDCKPLVNLERKSNLSWVSYVLRQLLSGKSQTRANGDRDQIITLLENGLTAVVFQDPVLMRYTNRWSMKSYVPELGLRASLLVDEVEDWFEGWVSGMVGDDGGRLRGPGDDPVGLRVPVKIGYINEDDHIVLRIDQSRMDHWMMQSTAADFVWKGVVSC